VKPPSPTDQPLDGIVDWVDRLSTTNPAKRLLAARTLRSELRVAMKTAERASPGTLRRDEALSRLDDLERHAIPACVSLIHATEDLNPKNASRVARACADILRLLHAEAAVPALESRASREKGRTRRKLERATRALRAAP
jgi:hypothetical protein